MSPAASTFIRFTIVVFTYVFFALVCPHTTHAEDVLYDPRERTGGWSPLRPTHRKWRPSSPWRMAPVDNWIRPQPRPQRLRTRPPISSPVPNQWKISPQKNALPVASGKVLPLTNVLPDLGELVDATEVIGEGIARLNPIKKSRERKVHQLPDEETKKLKQAGYSDSQVEVIKQLKDKNLSAENQQLLDQFNQEEREQIAQDFADELGGDPSQYQELIDRLARENAEARFKHLYGLDDYGSKRIRQALEIKPYRPPYEAISKSFNSVSIDEIYRRNGKAYPKSLQDRMKQLYKRDVDESGDTFSYADWVVAHASEHTSTRSTPRTQTSQLAGQPTRPAALSSSGASYLLQSEAAIKAQEERAKRPGYDPRKDPEHPASGAYGWAYYNPDPKTPSTGDEETNSRPSRQQRKRLADSHHDSDPFPDHFNTSNPFPNYTVITPSVTSFDRGNQSATKAVDGFFTDVRPRILPTVTQAQPDSTSTPNARKQSPSSWTLKPTPRRRIPRMASNHVRQTPVGSQTIPVPQTRHQSTRSQSTNPSPRPRPVAQEQQPRRTISTQPIPTPQKNTIRVPAKDGFNQYRSDLDERIQKTAEELRQAEVRQAVDVVKAINLWKDFGSLKGLFKVAWEAANGSSTRQPTLHPDIDQLRDELKRLQSDRQYVEQYGDYPPLDARSDVYQEKIPPYDPYRDLELPNFGQGPRIEQTPGKRKD